MKKRKNISLIFISTVLVLAFNANTFALSKKQQDKIITNCSSIKDTLKSIQHSDSYSRVYLESEYSEIFNNYIAPMNTRMQNNGIIHKELSENQEDFVEMRSKFKTDFITYSKQMETLINIDCENNPTEFYNQLEYVRISRNETNVDVAELSNIINEHQLIVKKMKDSL